jgi:aspartyl-tRNA(Asn)/glutamyl-tRNA(Gln) amidotransferase subunit A
MEGAICDDVPLDPEVQHAFDVALDVLRSLGGRTEEVSLTMPDLGRVIDVEAYAFDAPYLAGRAISGEDATRLRDELARYRATVPEVLQQVDVVALPTLPIRPIEMSRASEPFAMPACTFAFSLGGWPAVSVPCGYSASGLPIGLLLGGRPLSEPTLLALAHAYEQATPWRHRRPHLV